MQNKIESFTLSPGSLLQHYDIECVLGKPGGFGITYRARDTQLGRRVAIKEFLPTQLAVRDASNKSVKARTGGEKEFKYLMTRFLDEAKALAKFTHPNIVRVIHFFEANGTAYLVMEYVEGMPLSEYLEINGGTLGENEIYRLLMPILRGLDEIHASGFLHRDIKPSNIYIRSNGEPLLIDFGSAREAIDKNTQAVTSIISPGYAPPEQYASDTKYQGPWTDLYALGATLYHCTIGSAPLDSASRQFVKDEAPLTARLSDMYGNKLLELIDQMMLLDRAHRPASVKMVLEKLGSTIDVSHESDFDKTVILKALNSQTISKKNEDLRKRKLAVFFLIFLFVLLPIFFYIYYQDLVEDAKVKKTVYDLKEHILKLDATLSENMINDGKAWGDFSEGSHFFDVIYPESSITSIRIKLDEVDEMFLQEDYISALPNLKTIENKYNQILSVANEARGIIPKIRSLLDQERKIAVYAEKNDKQSDADYISLVSGSELLIENVENSDFKVSDAEISRLSALQIKVVARWEEEDNPEVHRKKIGEEAWARWKSSK